MGKAWFMVSTEYCPHGKDIVAPREYIPKFNSPNGKDMVLWRILSRSGNGHVKGSKKMHYERYNASKN